MKLKEWTNMVLLFDIDSSRKILKTMKFQIISLKTIKKNKQDLIINNILNIAYIPEPSGLL